MNSSLNAMEYVYTHIVEDDDDDAQREDLWE